MLANDKQYWGLELKIEHLLHFPTEAIKWKGRSVGGFGMAGLGRKSLVAAIPRGQRICPCGLALC